MSVTPPAPPRTEAKGALAGVIATLLGIPALGIGLVSGLFMQRTVLQLFLHREVELSDMGQGGTGILANVILAVLIGFIAACVSGMVSMKLVKAAALRAFMVVAGIGSLAVALGVDRALRSTAGGHLTDLMLLVGCGWLAALAGFYAAAALRDEPRRPAR